MQASRGAVLFELLIAVLVLAVGLTACLRTFGHALLISARSHHLFESVLLADGLLFDLASGVDEDLVLSGADGSFASRAGGAASQWLKPYGYEVRPSEFPSLEEAPPPVDEEEGGEGGGPSDYQYRRMTLKLTRAGERELEFPLVAKVAQDEK